MLYRIRHVTEYSYPARVSSCYNVARVCPRDTDRQSLIRHHVYVNPYPATINRREDYFGNLAYHFDIQKPHQDLTITAESDVDVPEGQPYLELDLGMSVAEAREAYLYSNAPDVLCAREFLLDSPMIRRDSTLAEYARPSFDDNRPLNAAVRELTGRIFDEFTFDPSFTTVATPLSEVLAHRRGVCQDFAHLQIACLRSLGIPARYVSGYLETLPPPGQKKMVGADATHAWISCFSPQEGWLEFDPTNNTMANHQHIVTAYGRDFFDVTPIKGVIYGGGDIPGLRVSVDVQRLSD
ncbi:putative protein [BD1-7 clade bacterium]|uniref:Transglutaminase-like domain-containing protein n=1 Tax=BD1-7 clade bacterium TaxID=2029982 RepID=A0A5S9MQ97_9GAMM|nr:putative protein [BD1-7 clade bacterium]